MREIKFRAWDSWNKKMHFDIGVINGKCIPLYDETWVMEQTKPYPNCADIDKAFRKIEGGIILMQYTGLKDKNGKEIYEGDIVRSDLTAIGDVFYFVEAASFYIEWAGEDDCQVLSEPILEVIGNIYENKELLDGVN